jgi:transcriptional regulator with XRE-family HTH domain
VKIRKSAQEEFLANSENRKLFEQEKLLVEATELLSELMEKKGVSRAQLAEKIGKSKAFVTQLLRGNHNMTLRTVADLFGALDHEVCLKSQPRDREQVDCTPAFEQKAWGYYYSRVGDFLTLDSQGTVRPTDENLGGRPTRPEGTVSPLSDNVAA